MAREDLLSHLDGDVTLLPPLVEVQQVGSEARGRLGSGACGDDVIMRTDRVAVTQMGCVPVCVTTLQKGVLRVCLNICWVAQTIADWKWLHMRSLRRSQWPNNANFRDADQAAEVAQVRVIYQAARLQIR